MFSSSTGVLGYTKITGITPENHDSCELRKISDTELNFLTIKPIQKQSP